MENENRITYFGETDFRNKKVRFGIKAKDRTRHVYVIGKTGMGKSTLLENMAAQDIMNGEGMAFMDPHGGSAEKLLEYVPEHRIKDVIYFAPFDIDNPISFNVMEDVGPDKRHLVVSGLMSAFKKIWVDAWSARMEYILNNILLALLEYPDATLLGVNRMLSDKDFRKKVVDNVSDPSVRAFWVDEFAKYGDRYMQEAGASIQNKIGQFTSNPVIRNIIGQPKSSFDIREVMDKKKILIINLSKGQIGEQNSNLLGGMIITKIYLSAMSRADVAPDVLARLPNFYFFVDEFQSFANESFADILSEARKYKLNLTIAHQYIEQMVEEVRNAVFGNVGTTISFRVGPFDAEVLEKIFLPTFTKEDIVNLGLYQMYLTMMIDGIGSKPFSASSMGPLPPAETSHKSEVVAHSQETYARKKVVVQEEISAWMATSFAPERPERGERDYQSGSPSGGAPRSRSEGARSAPRAMPSGDARADVDTFPRRPLPPRPVPQAGPASPRPVRQDVPPAAPRPSSDIPAPRPAPSRPVPPSVESRSSSVPEPSPVPLSALKAKKADPKAASDQSMNGLRAALLGALGSDPQEKPKPKPEENSVPKPVAKEQSTGAPVHDASAYGKKEGVPVKPEEPVSRAEALEEDIMPGPVHGAAEEVKKHDVNDRAGKPKREVPEDVLRRILE